MKRIRIVLMCLVLTGCSGLQNPFTGQSANAQLLQTICTTYATVPQIALGCVAVGMLNASQMPPAPVSGK